ncbi:MAG TPA: uroporphyrinogen decarboxylase [Candidatus Blautia gallistercoris]|uniref:Uroporphyrinogen decarboxylase n=1 Tax=Candidatus Blautia gallistercoris TaxID=2838490 RepID=A0A9D1WI15_9FIRM|nr:uroporphyrinogen decarboxylase [Candidatus Blautia gallistercoris]
MLTAKENLREVIRGGNPDRFVNQYEALQFLFHPYFVHNPSPAKGQENVVNAWGVTNSFPANTPGAFPVHTPDKIVVKDIEDWKEYVHAPSLEFSQEEWDSWKAQYDAADKDRAFATALVLPGLFEQTHHLCEISQALMNYITNPDEMHDLIKYLTEFELKLAEGICDHLHPEIIFHHDDWGAERSTFLRPEMFAEFFVEPYKEIYKYYHDHGVEFVFHHNDSYSATLVPYMIEMGIDVWQGCMESNDVPELVKKYGGKISFMGGIDNKSVDFEGWTAENCRKVAENICESCGNKYFIPCITQGGPGSVYPGVYAALCDEIDKYNAEKFGLNIDELKEQRIPWQILF